ncbi:MAG: molybdopterin-dependent oxidoreductase [Steroidobacteraceae bacterium]
MTTSISVTGAVEHTMTLGVEDLRAFPTQKVNEVPLVCQTGANLGKLENFKGVRLRDIIERAKVVAPGHNDVKKMVVIAGASDGYKVVFSWSEIFNSPVGDGVYVFADDEGRIAMISTKDLRTGPRHVKWLKDIEVRKILD